MASEYGLLTTVAVSFASLSSIARRRSGQNNWEHVVLWLRKPRKVRRSDSRFGGRSCCSVVTALLRVSSGVGGSEAEYAHSQRASWKAMFAEPSCAR
jgi:hypothetical protein